MSIFAQGARLPTQLNHEIPKHDSDKYKRRNKTSLTCIIQTMGPMNEDTEKRDQQLQDFTANRKDRQPASRKKSVASPLQSNISHASVNIVTRSFNLNES
ncbi:hypothetical protein BgiMline_011436 [Biomphalaria glabrata]